jgi:hypothetical protein
MRCCGDGRVRVFHSTFLEELYLTVDLCRLIINKTPFIIPNRLEWLGMLAMIGIFGFIAQVGHHTRYNLSHPLNFSWNANLVPVGVGTPARDRWTRVDGCVYPSKQENYYNNGYN